MKKLVNIIDSKRSLLGLLVLGGLIYTTYNIQDNSHKLKQVTNLESGIQTCFTRVNQSYTANMLADSASNYLTQNFQNLTEECFAEGILNVENSFKAELPNVAKLLSTLASNVHWFHEDILAPSNGFSKNNSGRDVGSRFEKIETTKDQIVETTDSYKTNIHSSLNQDKSLFCVFATLLAVMMIGEYMSITRKKLGNSAREKEALAELISDNGGATSVKVGEIIKTALEQNSLFHCARLFSNFHNQVGVERTKNKLSLDALVTPLSKLTSSTNEKLNQRIEKIWEDDNIGVSLDNKASKSMDDINLEQISSSVVDLLAEKLFSQGVQMDINIGEKLTVKSRHEELEQTLFHLMTFAINSTHAENGEKNITIFAHKLGDVIAFDLVYSGPGFNDVLLKHRAGLISGDDSSSIELDLQIAQSLLNEMDAKVQLDNKIDQSGNVVGGRVKIIFKAGAQAETIASNVKLVDLKVGSKKEILASMM